MLMRTKSLPVRKCDLSSESSSEESDDDIKNKVETVIKLAIVIIQNVINIPKAGVSPTDLSTNEISDEQSRTTTQVNSESLEDATS